MSKAFTKEDGGGEEEDDLPPGAVALPAGARNYITPAGFRRLQDEHQRLLRVERPEVVRSVSWAASNGDRSENAEYQYGKRRLRVIARSGNQRIDPDDGVADGIFGVHPQVHETGFGHR